MKKWALDVLPCLILSVIVTGCTSKEMRKMNKWMENTYSGINLEDGVDKDEAETLANVYFTCYISGCGAVSDALDKGDRWEVETVIGVAAKPYDSIFVEKKTGKIACRKGPTVKSPKELNKNLIR